MRSNGGPSKSESRSDGSTESECDEDDATTEG